MCIYSRCFIRGDAGSIRKLQQYGNGSLAIFPIFELDLINFTADIFIDFRTRLCAPFYAPNRGAHKFSKNLGLT